ncbi:MAG TPA: alanine racemase [Anaerolineae bacterium]|nr:alanine racemase [Anaerolineae bacterium]
MSLDNLTMTSAPILRPTHVEIDLDQISANYRAIQQHVAPAKVMAILKANAYGHGLVPIARHLAQLGAPYFGVAFLEEGILLRQAGINTPILVLGGIIGNQIPLFIEHDLTLTASSVEKLTQIDTIAAQLGRRARVHLKIDTGMERIGIHYYNADTLLAAAWACQHCTVEGVYSHFATADAADLTASYIQLQRFQTVLDTIRDAGHTVRLRHIANSGAILQMPETHFDMVRAGILLYGHYPDIETKQTITVQPALTWKSRVVYFKVVKPGHPISYGSTWQSDKLTRVVTIPVGYGDGYFRALSNKGELIIRGQRYPIVGRVCMDQLMVNIGWETAYNGDEVILLGTHPNGTRIDSHEMANWANTIPYEILTNINTRVPRTYI